MRNTSIFNISVIFIIFLFNFSFSFTQSKVPEGKIINYKPEEVKVFNLGNVINTKDLNYAPTMFNDDNMIIFVSNRKGSRMKINSSEPSHDFWIAGIMDDTTYDEPFNLDLLTADSVLKSENLTLNSPLNEGAGCYSKRFNAFFFTACNRPFGLGDCDIYCCFLIKGKFDFPFNLGSNVNSKYFDSQPSISDKDGRLYFISTRPGPNSDGYPKKNNFDIWYCDFDTINKSWKPAQNLVDINTENEEESPYIAPDGVTLFFSSTGLEPNYGETDFYVTRYDPDTKKWSKPENLGKPINTEHGEQFLTMPASGDCIYFSSTRTDLKGLGKLNIYKAVLPRPMILRK